MAYNITLPLPEGWTCITDSYQEFDGSEVTHLDARLADERTQRDKAFINIYVCSKVIDTVMMGFSGNKACFIMTSRWEQITRRLMDEVGRGVTHLEAKGAYTGREQPVVLCVAARQEIMSVKRIVQEEDEKAFMFITEAHEALGEGFSRLDSKD